METSDIAGRGILKARDTVATDTSAALATSVTVAFLLAGFTLFFTATGSGHW